MRNSTASITQDPGVSDARDRLIQVALDLFGRHGFEGTSTREIARAADKPMSAITYHFGSKQQLYIAVARYLAGRISADLAPTLAAAVSEQRDNSPGAARARIHRFMAAFVTMMVKPENAAWSRYILREQMDPTPAFDELYRILIGPINDQLADMVRRVAGDRIGPEEARLRVLALIGQVMVFRSCRATLMRGNAWAEIGAAEVGHICTVVSKHIDAALDAH